MLKRYNWRYYSALACTSLSYVVVFHLIYLTQMASFFYCASLLLFYYLLYFCCAFSLTPQVTFTYSIFKFCFNMLLKQKRLPLLSNEIMMLYSNFANVAFSVVYETAVSVVKEKQDLRA